MCVRIVNVHVSCSSHGNAQLAAFFIDPRAKGSTEMVCTFLQYFLKPTKHREGARVRQQEKYSIGVLPKKIFGVHKAQKKKYILISGRDVSTRDTLAYILFFLSARSAVLNSTIIHQVAFYTTGVEAWVRRYDSTTGSRRRGVRERLLSVPLRITISSPAKREKKTTPRTL